MSNGKVMINRLIAGLIKKRFTVILLITTSLYKNESIFSKAVWAIWLRY